MLSQDDAWQLIEDAMRDERDICVRRGGFSAAFSTQLVLRGKSPIVPESIVALAAQSLQDEDEYVYKYAAWLIEQIARNRRRSALAPHIDLIKKAHAESADATVLRATNRALHRLGHPPPNDQ